MAVMFMVSSSFLCIRCFCLGQIQQLYRCFAFIFDEGISKYFVVPCISLVAVVQLIGKWEVKILE